MRNLLTVLLLAHVVHHECATTYKCDETSSCGCAPVSPIVAKILGGEPSVTQSWPWIVSLRQPALGKETHFCAAVILEASYVITAAHCVYGKMIKLSNITVCAGSDRLSDSCLQSRSVRQVIIHHDYKNKTHEHDIAIVQLDEPFDFTDRWISKICLPSAETESPYPPVGTSVLAIGWGKTREDNVGSDKLQQVTLKVIDDSTSSCSNLLYNKEVQLCASGLDKNTCRGDSGGPLMQFTAENLWELVGITSYGDSSCTLPNRPGAYVRVSVYHQFIKSVIRNTYVPPVQKSHTCECQCPYGTDSGVALTSTYSAESCIRACISILRSPCSSRNTYACLNTSCVYSSSYEHLTTTTTSALDLNLTSETVVTWPNGDKYVGSIKDGKRHGRGTYYFSNGNNFTGDWIDGMRTGQGIMVWSNGIKYTGTWYNSKRTGKGIMIWPDGKNYTGDWVDDKKAGQGVFTWPSGDKYEGQFQEDWRHGVGTYYFPNGKNYTGDWVNGSQTGQGLMNYPDGGKYIGAWFNDSRNGKGVLIDSDGNTYTGDWVNDMRTGQGVVIWSSGAKYEGQLQENWKNGVGTQRFSDGSKYVGNWIKGSMTGQGVMTWPDGKKYIGTWFDDGRNGKGSMIWPDGKNYTGDWINDMRTGQGVFTWPSGAKYEGQFEKDWRHGAGTYHFSSGNVYVGDWVEGDQTGQGVMTWYNRDKYVGDWINDEKNGEGIMTWSNGNRYIGDWKDDVRKGEGVMTWSNGDTYIGDWVDDMRTGYGIYTSSDGVECQGHFNEGVLLGDSECNINMKL